MRHRLPAMFGILVTLVASVPHASADTAARATRDDATYRIGETVTFDVPSTTPGKYVVLKDGNTPIAEGATGATPITASLDTPGWLLLEVTPDGGKPTYAGAVVAPREIAPAAKPPADFDAWWDVQVATLAKLPMNASLEKVDVDPAVDYFRVTLDNVDGTHVYGQLARPKAPGKLPALLSLQWAGVYGLQRDWAIGRARQGFIVLNISAHDFPIDLPEPKVKELADGPLNNYVAIGQTSRETSYFRRMFLGCVRAADYLATRDDWDGRVLAASGGSQGGLQAIATAALSPKVTHVLAEVPAGCATNAAYKNPWWPWPYWYGRAHAGKADAERDAILETGRYFDATNFAHRVRVPTLVGVGLADTTSPASGVLTMAHELAGKVELFVMPRGTHTEHHEAWQKRYETWLDAIQHGKPLP